MNSKIKTYVIQGFTDAPAAGNRYVRLNLPPQQNNYLLRSIDWEDIIDDNVTGLIKPRLGATDWYSELSIILLDASMNAAPITPPAINNAGFPWDIINLGNALKSTNPKKWIFENLIINDSFVLQYRLYLSLIHI